MITGQDLIKHVNQKYMEAGNESYLSAAPFTSANQYQWFKNAKWDYNWLTVEFPNKTYKFRTVSDYTVFEDNGKICTITYVPDTEDQNELDNSIMGITAAIYRSASYTITCGTDIFDEFWLIMHIVLDMMLIG